MGYEIKAYIVQEYSFERGLSEEWPLTGGVLGMVELCKLGDGALMDLIRRSRPAEGERRWGLWAFNPDRQQEAVDFIREEVKPIAEAQEQIKERYGDSVHLEHPLRSADEIQKLSNAIEDGTITEDCYGDALAVMDCGDVIQAIRQELQKEDYRRFRWLLKLLFAIKHTFPDNPIKVIAYGH